VTGNRKSFDKAMKKAENRIEQGAWNKAIREYQWALREFPDDVGANTALGIAYIETDQLQPAAQLFKKLVLMVPKDEEVLQCYALVRERLGESDEAARLYLTLAELRRKENKLDAAIEAYAHSIRLASDSELAHFGLADALTRSGRPKEAADARVAWAKVLNELGRNREAKQVLSEALQLDQNHEAARLLLQEPQVVEEKTCRVEECEPLEAARHAAWAELAGFLFEDEALERLSDSDGAPDDFGAGMEQTVTGVKRSQATAILSQAVNLDTKGDVAGAIAAYYQVLESGMERAPIYFALGLLHRANRDMEESVKHLTAASLHPTYSLASHLALGDCYEQTDRPELATQHYIHALKAADLQTVDETRAPDLAALYDGLTDGYRFQDPQGREAATQQFTLTVKAFFHEADWAAKAMRLREHLDGLSTNGTTMSLAEGVGPGFGEILNAMNQIQALVARGMLLTSREECYRAIEKFPEYLPLHLKLADIFVRDGMLEDAVAKYTMTAQVYEVWRETSQAINVYRQILALTPLDVKVRSTLIDLLITRQDYDQAIEQYLALADAYYQQARVDKALEKFNEALRLTTQSQDEKAWRLKILYFMGDLYTQRVDWKKSISIYEQILELSPDEDQAALHLMDLQFKQNRPDQATAILQQILERHESDSEALLKVLREAARLRPNEMILRARLSQAYIERGLRQEAIAELDALGELQLEAGLRDQAIQTIRLIVSLKPANTRAYKQLLYHLLN
jgi:tetratricopeptide (TPR) repeat protein